ncbi:MAG: hypothetical protein J5679_01195 [Alphaproteobacteria bacterium]|nr:hypothetical protein [Alphaproteobacteria bacterium]
MPKTAKKAPAKKAVKKVVKPAAAVKPAVKEIPLPDPYCHCTKRKRNCILTCVFTGSLILDIVIGHLFFCDCWKKHNAPHFEFTNGCLNVESIKCPKMLEQLPAIDVNNDGCITHEELDASKKAMHRK